MCPAGVCALEQCAHWTQSGLSGCSPEQTGSAGYTPAAENTSATAPQTQPERERGREREKEREKERERLNTSLLNHCLTSSHNYTIKSHQTLYTPTNRVHTITFIKAQLLPHTLRDRGRKRKRREREGERERRQEKKDRKKSG